MSAVFQRVKLISRSLSTKFLCIAHASSVTHPYHKIFKTCFLTPTCRPPSVTFSTALAKMSPKKVCIIGSGNWGSAIAKIVGQNTAAHPDLFVKETPMWVFEEEIKGRKLTEIINTEHE